VRVALTPENRLTLSYTLAGDIQALLIPPRRPFRRVDQLWRHTCCEAFISAPGTAAYWECNFSPSTEWAIYRFRAYREGMGIGENAAPLALSVASNARRLDLSATLDLRQLPLTEGAGGFRLALSTVIEEVSGRISYWALRHPPGQPDFHHPAGFLLRLGDSASSAQAT
jgi:hypothetical protein